MRGNDSLQCVVFGAGALGLGFLGPELTGDCRVVFIDVTVKADLMRHLQAAGSYRLNQSGPAIHSFTVRNVDGLYKERGSVTDQALQALQEADLVFTAVGASHLPELGPVLAAAAARRSPACPLRVLCAENGLRIADQLREAAATNAETPLRGVLRVGDTMMGRAAKTVQQPRPPLRPVADGLDWAVLADRFFGIHAEKQAVEGLPCLPAALRAHPPATFKALEDAKLLTHNGLHCTLASWATLKGIEWFCEIADDPRGMALARRLLWEEAAPALLRRHAAHLDRGIYLNYCEFVLRRVLCPVFRDPVSRGVRGIMRKLRWWERLVHGLRLVSEEGFEPRAFATGVAAAVTIARRSGETELDFDEALTEHCGLDPEEDAGLLSLVSRQREELPG